MATDQDRSKCRETTGGDRCAASWTVDFQPRLLRALKPNLAQHGEAAQSVTYRNGYRTAPGIPGARSVTMELHIPKLREGSYFPSLLEPAAQREGSGR